jgi:hypothetical protein
MEDSNGHRRVAVSVVIGMQHRRGSAVGFIVAALTVLAYPLGNSPSHKSGKQLGSSLRRRRVYCVAFADGIMKLQCSVLPMNYLPGIFVLFIHKVHRYCRSSHAAWAFLVAFAATLTEAVPLA